MSKATKRKHVVKEVLDDYVLPENNQEIVRVYGGRGNNLHEVENAAGERFLVSMPTKFRKNIWIKRGDYVMIESIEEGDKVKGEIAHILYREQIKYIQDQGKWPTSFTEGACDKNTNSVIPDDMLPPSDSDSDTDEHLGEMVVNTNRPTVTYDDQSSDSGNEDG